MIRLYTGWVGSGKTYSMVRDARTRFLKQPRAVFTNMAGLRLPEAVYIDALDDLPMVGNGVVLLDELGVFMSSRYWSKCSQDVLVALAQVRKNGVDLYATAQDKARVDTVVRELMQEEVRCRSFGRWVLQVTLDPAARQILRRRVFRIDTHRLAWCYDTYETIGSRGGSTGEGAIVGGVPLSRVARRAAGAASRDRDRNDPWTEDPIAWTGRSSRLTLRARQCLEVLKREGRLAPESVSPWVTQVRMERRRWNWLRFWGLTPQDVDASVNPEHPWLPGYGPTDAEHRRSSQRTLGREAYR